jgi:two-component system phosphate regulon sensor histidine kinase PhoR
MARPDRNSSWKIPASASARNISRLTERFYRVDKSRSRETQGTGLGLAIVKHVLLRHGGTLAIQSVADKGSSFIVSMPKSVVTPLQGDLLVK